MIERVIFDWKGTLYDKDADKLLPGAAELVEYVNEQGIQQFLIGKGSYDMHKAVRRQGIARFFTSILFKPEDKTIQDFADIISLGEHERTLVIGDRVRSEISIGNRLGAMTMQVQQGRFAHEGPLTLDQIPDIIVPDLATAQTHLAALQSLEQQQP